MRVALWELAEFWKRSLVTLPARAEVILVETMAMGAEQSKAMIGHERPEWPPLARSTVQEKTRLGLVGRVSATDPLLATGEMRDSITFEAVYPQGAFGSTDPKSVNHEFGTARIPPRPFIAPVAEEIAVVLNERLAQLCFDLIVPSVLEDVI